MFVSGLFISSVHAAVSFPGTPDSFAETLVAADSSSVASIEFDYETLALGNTETESISVRDFTLSGAFTFADFSGAQDLSASDTYQEDRDLGAELDIEWAEKGDDDYLYLFASAPRDGDDDEGAIYVFWSKSVNGGPWTAWAQGAKLGELSDEEWEPAMGRDPRMLGGDALAACANGKWGITLFASANDDTESPDSDRDHTVDIGYPNNHQLVDGKPAIATATEGISTGAEHLEFSPALDGAGAVYAWTQHGNNWKLAAVFRSVAAAGGADFGSALDCFDDILAVGAPNDDSLVTDVIQDDDGDFQTGGTIGGANSGLVEIFKRSSHGVWWREAVIKGSDNDAGDMFGSSVYVWDEDTILVGAPGVNGGNGKVYLFERDDDGEWEEAASQEGPTAAAEFGGHDIWTDGAVIYVSDESEEILYVYQDDGATWQDTTATFNVASKDALAIGHNGHTIVVGDADVPNDDYILTFTTIKCQAPEEPKDAWGATDYDGTCASIAAGSQSAGATCDWSVTECNHGLTTTGAAAKTWTCGLSGWTGMVPRCLCNALTQPADLSATNPSPTGATGFDVTDCATVEAGDTCTVTAVCPGPDLQSYAAGEVERTCRATGFQDWRAWPKCQPVAVADRQCEWAHANAHIPNRCASWDHGEWCSPQCAAGYTPSANRIWCDEGDLTPATVTCERQCSLTATQVASNDGLGNLPWCQNVRPGGRCDVKCAPGYSPATRFLNCAATGGAFVETLSSLCLETCDLSTLAADVVDPTGCEDVAHGRTCQPRCPGIDVPEVPLLRCEDGTLKYDQPRFVQADGTVIAATTVDADDAVDNNLFCFPPACHDAEDHATGTVCTLSPPPAWGTRAIRSDMIMASAGDLADPLEWVIDFDEFRDTAYGVLNCPRATLDILTFGDFGVAGTDGDCPADSLTVSYWDDSTNTWEEVYEACDDDNLDDNSGGFKTIVAPNGKIRVQTGASAAGHFTARFGCNRGRAPRSCVNRGPADCTNNNAANPFVAVGPSNDVEEIPHGGVCNPICPSGQTPSVTAILCHDGELDAYTCA